MTAIGEQAFSGCTALVTVTAKIAVPFAINDNTFDAATYQTATLYVPVGAKARYQAAAGWKNFYNIVEKDLLTETRGDVNGDGVVNAADIVEIVNIIMSAK